MRKRSLLAALLAVCLLLCACTRSADTAQEADLAIQPVLHIGTAIFAPYFYMGEDGNYTGVDYEIAQEACARMGYTPDFTVMDWGDRDEVLASGSVDCIWNCFIMTGREDSYQWAGPYLNTSIAVVEHKAALQQMIAADPTRYRCLDKPLFVARAGVGFALDADPALVQALDDALNSMLEDGTIAAIAQRYGLDARDYEKVGDFHAH